MSFSITNLFNSIGDDKLKLHNLDQVMTGFKRKRGCNEVSFTTEMDLARSADLFSRGALLEQAAIIMIFDREHLSLINGPDPDLPAQWEESVNELRNLYLALKAVKACGANMFFGKDKEYMVDELLEVLEKAFGQGAEHGS